MSQNDIGLCIVYMYKCHEKARYIINYYPVNNTKQIKNELKGSNNTLLCQENNGQSKHIITYT